MAAKKDCYCLSKKEYEALIKPKKKRTVKKASKKPKTATKPKCKCTTPKKKVRAASKPKTATRTTKTTSIRKSKSVRNTNATNVAVSVSSNPRATSNIYLVTPQSSPRTEPRKKRTYDAPFLPRRSYDGQTVSTPVREKTVYIESPSTPEVIVGPSVSRTPKAVSETRRDRKGRKQQVLPPERPQYYLPPAVEVLPPADSCDMIQNKDERAACKRRKTKK